MKGILENNYRESNLSADGGGSEWLSWSSSQ